MSQRDGFASGFFAGAILGSVVGGIVGSLITRRDLELIEGEEPQLTDSLVEAGKKPNILRRRLSKAAAENQNMETARLNLEDKIAQLNATIDEVRKQLGNVDSNISGSTSERSRLDS